MAKAVKAVTEKVVATIADRVVNLLGAPLATSGQGQMWLKDGYWVVLLPAAEPHISNSALDKYGRTKELPGYLTMGSARFTSGRDYVQIQTGRQVTQKDVANIAAQSEAYINREKRGAKGGGFYK